MTPPRKPRKRKGVVPDARVILGDCIEAMQTLEAESIDALVTDPPYG